MVFMAEAVTKSKPLIALIYLSLVVFPFGELLRINVGNNIILKPLDLLIGFAAFTFFLVRVIGKDKFPDNRLTKPFIVFLAIAFLSLLTNVFNLSEAQLITSFLYLLRFISYAFAYFVISAMDKKIKKNILTLLFIDGAIILFLGYIQYFFYPDLRNLFYLGWDEHNHRMFSVFLDPNFTGALLTLFMVLIIGLAYDQIQKNNIKNIILLVIVAIFTFIAIFLTYSRSAMLMLFFCFGSYFVLLNKKKLILAGLGIVGVMLIALLPTFNKENTNLLRVTSSYARLESYGNAIKVIKDRPFLGVGFNTYRYAQQSYGFRKSDTKFESHGDAGVDSSLLFVMATTGIFGFCAYIYLWYSMIKSAFVIRGEDKVLANVVIASTIGIFVNSIFINSLFFPSIMLWIWVVLAIADEY